MFALLRGTGRFSRLYDLDDHLADCRLSPVNATLLAEFQEWVRKQDARGQRRRVEKAAKIALSLQADFLRRAFVFRFRKTQSI